MSGKEGDMMRLKDKVAVITGSGRGIGAAIARLFAREGAKVVISDIDERSQQETFDQIRKGGGQAIACFCDVTDRSSIQKLVDETLKELGTIDILINNAGIVQPAMISKMAPKEWDRVLDVNLKGAFNCLQIVGRVFLEKAEKNPEAPCSGKVVNISSIAGLRGSIGQINYAAAKAGLLGLTMSAAREWGKYKINVNAVAFGVVETEMSKVIRTDPRFSEMYRQQIALGRFAKPEEVALAVLFLASSEADYITGQVLVVDGGMHISL